MSEKRPTHVALVGVCPHCGEAVKIIVSKKQAKILFKAFKLSIKQAQLWAEKHIEIELQKP